MNRWLCGLVVVLFAVPMGMAEDKLTEEAAKTKNERLKVKASVEWEKLFLYECLNDLISKIDDKDLGKIEVKYDAAGGVSRNTRMTYSAKDKTIEEILNDFLSKNDMKYSIISKKGDKTDGGLLIKKK